MIRYGHFGYFCIQIKSLKLWGLRLDWFLRGELPCRNVIALCFVSICELAYQIHTTRWWWGSVCPLCKFLWKYCVCRVLGHNFISKLPVFFSYSSNSSCLWQLDSVLQFFCLHFSCRCLQINETSCHFGHISGFIPALWIEHKIYWHFSTFSILCSMI